nr:hypothetical protein [Tanacetum cinerariifolium]
MTESPFVDSSFVIPVFSLGDDPIACLNKAMAFLTAVASLGFPFTNNQLRTSSNSRNKATIQDGRVTVQQIQGRQRQNYSGTTYKGNATSSKGNTTSGHARVVKCYNCLISQAQKIIPHNATFQTEDLDTYDSDCDDLSAAQAVLMVNISKYCFNIISEVPNSETYLNDMDNQIVKKMIDSQMDDMIKEKLALKEKVDSLEQDLSKQIKEKECLLETLNVFQNESKEKENKYMENEIDLEKKIKELDNIVYKVVIEMMAFEQRSSKPGLQSMTSGHISSELDLTYAPSTITTQQPSEGELDLLFEAMCFDYIGGQPSATARTVPPAQEPQVRQSSTASTTIADTAPIPTNSSSHATNIPISSQDVDELNSNAMVDGNTFVNPFANSFTNAAALSSH